MLSLSFIASVQGQTRPLVLISETTSTRAIALESITFAGQPFPVTSLISWGPDQRTRVIVFVLNLQLQPGEALGNVTADAEDGTHIHYPLDVESVEPVPSQPWMSAVYLRLSDQMGNQGDVLVRIRHQGRASNRVRIAIGQTGGGLADDPGSRPTPAPPYAIRGRITVNGTPFGGVTVSLSGGATSVVTATDTEGNYSILAPSAADYVLSASTSDEDYIFEPANYSVTQIDGERHADFSAVFHRVLSGRVANTDGRGVFGVTVTLSGTQTGTTSTASDGTYSFPFTTFGNYVLTPSKIQGYYSFAPQNVRLTGRPGNRRADFSAPLNVSLSPSYVLEFDGTPKTVDYSIRLPDDYNLFWPDGVEYGHFFWEFWAMPGANASGTYLISDGYGGAHAILFGVSNFGTIPGRYQLAGNVWNGSNYVSFGSDDGPAPNEWGHLAVGWDGTNITTYFNGVPVGQTSYVGPRITPGGGQGCGRLLIGGSDHLNFQGRIAQVRGFENNNPREIGSLVFATFAPQTVFSVDGNLLSYFFRPSNDIADLSQYGQYGRQHPGLVRSTANGVINEECPGCPVPQFVIDPTAPDFANPNQPGQPSAPVDTPAPVPTGALIFDSFSRANSTYALGGVGGLRSSEGGSLGPKVWQTSEGGADPLPFGILNGHGVPLANTTALTWVNTGSGGSNFEIRTERRARTFGTGHNTGISFRVVDASNYFFAYSSDGANTSRPQTLTVGHRVAGLRTALASGVSMPVEWTTMTVVTTGAGAILVYADGTLLYSASSSLFSNSDGMGLYNNGPGLGLTNRWENFRVSVAQP
ncbi:MAG: carboxypeptidase regulatory-like domain-containing protein [Pyrinomonadaceae bacterium]|nr:carboxypeptidase regulatory-like domain-containing protein [Pyrinomonadaceae bacterium]